MLTSKYKNFCFGVIGTGGITSGQGLDTTFLVTPDTTSGALPTSGEFVIVVYTSTCQAPHLCANREGIRIKSRSGNTLTIKARNNIAEGVQQAWVAGDKYVLAIAAEAIDEIETGINNSLINDRDILQEVINNPLVSVLDTVETGWTQEYATFVFDTTDFVVGEKSGKLTTTNGAGPYNAVAYKNVSCDLSGCSVGMWIKKDSTITGMTIIFLAPDWSNYATIGVPTSYLPNDMWCFVPIHMDGASKTGSPNLSNIATIRIEATSNVNTAVLKFDGIVVAKNILPNGAIIITFDDIHSTDFTVAKLKMDSYGFKGVSFGVGDSIGTAGKLSLAQLGTMRDSGWDIGSHGMTHVDFTTLNDAQIRKETFDMKRYLITNGFQAGSRFFAYPFSAVNTTAHNIVSKYHLITRLVMPFSATAGFTGMPLFSPYTIMACDSANTTPANMLIWIQNVKANKGLGVMLFHKLVASAPSQYEHLIADFNTFIDNIYAEGVPVITMSNLVDMYISSHYNPDPMTTGKSIALTRASYVL